MRKSFQAIALLVATLSFTACDEVEEMVDITRAAQAIEAESSEISSGHLFLIEKGTIVYNDCITVTFEDYGDNIAIETKSTNKETGALSVSRIIANSGEFVYIDDTNKTYNPNILGSYQALWFVFRREAYYAAVNYGDDLNKYLNDDDKIATNWITTSETILGNKCEIYTSKENSELSKIGGWNRIVFVIEGKIDGENESYRATDFKTDSTPELFVIPEDYKRL
ncbi:MAG: hypothetical protein HUJ96_09175 [Marinilabiliaceae bacterium]|nr:hypothetical protein [Marinilabiliaceae bacterium]